MVVGLWFAFLEYVYFPKYLDDCLFLFFLYFCLFCLDLFFRMCCLLLCRFLRSGFVCHACFDKYAGVVVFCASFAYVFYRCKLGFGIALLVCQYAAQFFVAQLFQYSVRTEKEVVACFYVFFQAVVCLAVFVVGLHGSCDDVLVRIVACFLFCQLSCSQQWIDQGVVYGLKHQSHCAFFFVVFAWSDMIYPAVANMKAPCSLAAEINAGERCSHFLCVLAYVFIV